MDKNKTRSRHESNLEHSYSASDALPKLYDDGCTQLILVGI